MYVAYYNLPYKRIYTSHNKHTVMRTRVLRSLLGLLPSLSANDLEDERRKEIEREKEKYST